MRREIKRERERSLGSEREEWSQSKKIRRKKEKKKKKSLTA